MISKKAAHLLASLLAFNVNELSDLIGKENQPSTEKDPNSPKVAKAEAKRRMRAAKINRATQATATPPAIKREPVATKGEPVATKGEPIAVKMATVHGQLVKITCYPSVKNNPEYYWDRQQEIDKKAVKRFF